ncbi:uncharacterized protein BDZ99DRAFT_468759 [Mytilinidion resinicola]|uniref:DUF4334 domain-containing protein n=1 Tax=Mytilinidion resinicola TaxID=574789 RepID=A0A6A6Y4T7_9PEZI|nr:uncharacterized protein BDZ99DRAFT_468759 [Mytilinidion resinicola]KAF2802807.1 hypothetical protein BDZ99DRAFT_468759 [Mytilinidion resinicola]
MPSAIESAGTNWIALTKKTGKVEEREAEKIFETLPPAPIETFKGSWKGFSVNTGHPGPKKNDEVRWAGKNFWGVDDVEPMVQYNEAGERVWMEQIGKARFREVKYKGVLSTAMIYDKMPITDHFRLVNDDMVAGVMDTHLFPGEGNMYFYLTKL